MGCCSHSWGFLVCDLVETPTGTEKCLGKVQLSTGRRMQRHLREARGQGASSKPTLTTCTQLNPLDALQFPLSTSHTGFPAGAAPQQHYTSLLFDLCKIEEPSLCDTFSFFFFSTHISTLLVYMWLDPCSSIGYYNNRTSLLIALNKSENGKSTHVQPTALPLIFMSLQNVCTLLSYSTAGRNKLSFI